MGWVKSKTKTGKPHINAMPTTNCWKWRRKTELTQLDASVSSGQLDNLPSSHPSEDLSSASQTSGKRRGKTRIQQEHRNDSEFLDSDQESKSQQDWPFFLTSRYTDRPTSKHQALGSLGSWRRDQTSLNICKIQHLRHLSVGESGYHWAFFWICRLWIRVGTYVQEKLKVSENLAVLECRNANTWALAGHLKN